MAESGSIRDLHRTHFESVLREELGAVAEKLLAAYNNHIARLSKQATAGSLGSVDTLEDDPFTNSRPGTVPESLACSELLGSDVWMAHGCESPTFSVLEERRGSQGPHQVSALLDLPDWLRGATEQAPPSPMRRTTQLPASRRTVECAPIRPEPLGALAKKQQRKDSPAPSILSILPNSRTGEGSRAATPVCHGLGDAASFPERPLRSSILAAVARRNEVQVIHPPAPVPALNNRRASLNTNMSSSHTSEDTALLTVSNCPTSTMVHLSTSLRSVFGVRNTETISEDSVDEGDLAVLGLWNESVHNALKSARIFPGTFRTIDMIMTPHEDPRKRWWGAPRIVSPNSLLRLFWDVLSVACIVHDTVVAPMEFLQVPRGSVRTILDWCARLFWTADIAASFFTGVNLSDGSVELRRCAVAKHYLRTWLLPDLVIVLSDWMEVSLHEATMASQLIGLLRMLRLLRLLRLQKLLAMAAERASSERVSLIMSLLRCVGAILGLAHAMASAWLGIGRNGAWGWVSARGVDQEDYLEQYVLAFHWSITNFAGSMDLQPQTRFERVYAIVSLLLGFLVASWLVSSITSSMTRLSIIASKKTMQFAVLNKYMKENGLSRDLSRRVLLNAKRAFAEKEEHMQESDVHLLSIVSEPLLAEVHLEIFLPPMVCHPLFDQLRLANLRVLQQICHAGVSVVTLEEGDIAFTRGELPHVPKMIFVVSGILEYTRAGDASTMVTAGQWVSEQVVWTSWVYHGNLQANNSCRLLVLDTQTFWRICGPGQLGSLEMRNYAVMFVEWLNSGFEARSDVGNKEECRRITEAVFGMYG